MPPAPPGPSMSSNLRQTPLTCSGHTRFCTLSSHRKVHSCSCWGVALYPRPVVFLAFSEINSDGIYYSISACKDGKPMLRQVSGEFCQVATQ